MGMFDGIQNWLVNIALKKASAKAVKAAVAVIAAPGLIAFLAANGVKVEIDNQALEAGIVAGVIFGYEFVRNFLRGKGLSFLP